MTVAAPALVGHRSLEVLRSTVDRPTGAGARRPAIHAHGRLVLVTAGAARFWLDGTYALRPGDLFLVPEGRPHYFVEADAARCVGLGFCTSCLDGPAGEALRSILAGVRAGGAAVRSFDPPAAARVERHLEALEAELGTARAHRPLALDGLLALLVVEVSRASPTVRSLEEPGPAPLVARALEYIGENALRGISLRDVAGSVDRAAPHLATVMKEATGRTVVEWITHARMATARQLLRRTDASVEVVAARVGFASPSHFHRVFRREHGATPAAWRRVHGAGRSSIPAQARAGAIPGPAAPSAAARSRSGGDPVARPRLDAGAD